MRPVTFRDRARYRFDAFMSKGAGALIGALFLASALIIFLVAALVHVTGSAPEGPEGERPGLVTLVWKSMMHAMDAGTLGGDEGSSLSLLLWLVVTLGGIFIVSAFIGVLNNGLTTRIEELRKGRSRVIEDGHTLILGWSSQVATIVSEIASAAMSEGGRTIVVMAEKDKVEMDEELAIKVPDLHGSRLVCRSGSPIDLDDLELGSPETARAILVIGSEDAKDPDASVIKTVLALVAHKPRPSGRHHIVAEVRDPKNHAPLTMVGKDQLVPIVSSEIIARIAVQTCRQAGLSAIYAELLDFGGSEIYVRSEPSLAGRTYGAALFAFPESTLIGIVDEAGVTRLNPPTDSVIQEGAKVVVIAEDDDQIRVVTPVEILADAVPVAKKAAERTPERTVILGWNRRGPTVVRELDKYVPAGSHLTIVADDDAAELALRDMAAEVVHQTVEHLRGDITDRRLLDGLALSTYRHVITLSYTDKLDVQEADAITLVTLLHLRDIEDKLGESFSTVSEMLDLRNQKLAEVTKTDDFIVSDTVISLLMSQLAETKELAAVFDDLFDAEGCEIYLRPAGEYAPSRGATFSSIVAVARDRGETAIGYTKGTASERTIHFNPKKSEKLELAGSDQVIVIAQC